MRSDFSIKLSSIHAMREICVKSLSSLNLNMGVHGSLCLAWQHVLRSRMERHTAKVRINRVRLSILLVVSGIGKMNISLSPFAPENLVSRNGFGSPVPRQPAHLHTQAESGTYLRHSSRVLRQRPFIYFKPPYVIGSVPSLLGHAPMAFTAESPPAQGQ